MEAREKNETDEALEHYQKAVNMLETAIERDKKEDLRGTDKPPIYRNHYKKMKNLLKKAKKMEKITKGDQVVKKVEESPKKEPMKIKRNKSESKSSKTHASNANSVSPSQKPSSSLSKYELKSLLQNVNEYDFEHLVADLWEHEGWDTSVTKGSNDHGIDVIATKRFPYPEKQIIQAKRYKEGNKVGSQDVQLYSSLQNQEDNVDAVIIATSSSFTKQATTIADKLNVKLVNGNRLAEWISRKEIDVELSAYF